MASSASGLFARLGDDRNLRNRNHAPRTHSPVSSASCVTYVTQQSSNVRGQALPATMPVSAPHPSTVPKSAFAEITNGFLLTSQCTMDQAKTMASKLSGYKKDKMRWRLILNNATSTRPKQCGGPTCQPIRDLLQYYSISDLKKDPQPFLEPRADLSTRSEDFTKLLQECPDGWTCAILDMPNSFYSRIKVAAAATSKDAAMEKVCLLAFSHLLLHSAESVLVRPNHWAVSVETLVKDARAIFNDQSPASGSAVNPVLAPPPRSRKAQSYYEAPPAGEEAQRERRICQILSELILSSQTGWVNPTYTRNWQLLRQYVPPGSLQTFIEQHAQFKIYPDSGNTWMFGFNTNSGVDGHKNNAHGDVVFDPKHFFQCLPEQEVYPEDVQMLSRNSQDAAGSSSSVTGYGREDP